LSAPVILIDEVLKLLTTTVVSPPTKVKTD